MHLQRRHVQTRRQSRPSPSCCLSSARHHPAPRLRHISSIVTGVALSASSSTPGSRLSSSTSRSSTSGGRSRGSNGLGRLKAAGHTGSPAISPTGPMKETSLSFANPAGEQLSAKLVDTGSDDVVILCHGYAGNKDGFLWPRLATELAGHGRSSLRFDFAGNGASEGAFSFGGYWREVGDLRAAVEHVRQQMGRRVAAIVGHSKGGNVVLLYASKYDDVPYVVNVSGRGDMKRGVKERFGQDILTRLEAGPVEQTVRSDTGKVITYSLTKESVQERMALDMFAEAAKITASHVLTVHCTADAVIPVEDAHALDRVIPRHKLFVVQGGDHNFRGQEAGAQCIRRTVDFITTGI